MLESDQKNNFLFGAFVEAFRKRRAFSFAGRPMPKSEDSVEDVPRTSEKARAMQKAVALFEEKLAKADLKITASEYIRLLELLQQVDEDKPREIRIRWVDQDESTESSTEE